MHSELYPRESSCFWCDWTTAKTSHKSHWSVFSLQTSSIATSLAFYSTQTRYRYRYRPGTGHWRGDQARSRTVSVLAIKTDTVQVSVRTLIWASRSLGPGLGLKILGIGHICSPYSQSTYLLQYNHNQELTLMRLQNVPIQSSLYDVIFILTHLLGYGFTEEKIVDCLTAAAVLVVRKM